MEYKSIYNRGNSPNKLPLKKQAAPQPPKPPRNTEPKQQPPKPPADGEIRSKAVFTIAVLSFFIILGVGTGAFLAFTQEIPEVADLRNYKPSMSTVIFDKDDNLVSQLYTEQRTLIKIADVPQNLQNAILAKEDPRFYQHGGFDVKGILRATITNMIHGKIVEGASTITQQLARNLFLTHERSFGRKIKEVLLAMQVEKYYTKEEILELYCNQIYFGSGAYGVEAAARTYFGKHAPDLLLEECAMLAALPQAPNQFSPYRNPDLALEKRNIVLDKMAERGFISPEDREYAKSQPIVLNKLEVKNAPYFVEYVRQQLEASYGSSVIYKGGLRVQTTLDSALQSKAQEVFNRHIKKLEAEIKESKPEDFDAPLQGAMLGIDPRTGQIKIMIGGIDFSKSEFNRAVQSKRQTGSAFKPIVYTTAIANGFRVSDIIMDSPIVFKNDDGTDWKPENFSGKFSGPVTIMNGLTYSKNVVTVKLLNKVGIGTVRKMARSLGITSPLAGDLTLGLGSSSLSLFEMVMAFCPLANEGMMPQPLSILAVKDNEGKIIEQHAPNLSEALPETTAYIMTFMLENVINAGTGKVIRDMGFRGPCAGKTGTTNDFTDAWFIGYTPELVLGIWIGFDTKEKMNRKMTGGYAAAPMWGEFMINAFGSAKREFAVPDKISFKKICTKSGDLATTSCPSTIDAPFVTGTEPFKECAIHSQVQTNNFLGTDLEGYESTEDYNEEESSSDEPAEEKQKPSAPPASGGTKQPDKASGDEYEGLSF